MDRRDLSRNYLAIGLLLYGLNDLFIKYKESWLFY